MKEEEESEEVVEESEEEEEAMEGEKSLLREGEGGGAVE